MVLLLACWSPDLDEGTPSLAPLPADGDVPEEAAPEPEVPDAPEEAPEAPPFPAYPAKTLTAPVTLVDDWGKPLAIVRATGTVVEVRGEEDIRKKVWCGVCDPPTEGWVQRTAVGDRE